MELAIPSNQRTLKHEALVTGRGYRGEEKCILRLLPADRDTGVLFVGSGGAIQANYFQLAKSFSNTTLQCRTYVIETVEHLLSALYGSFVDNVEIEVYGGIPMGDGSSKVFFEAIEDAGIVEQNAPRRYLEITRPVSVEDNGSFISITPADYFSITYLMGDPYPKAVHGKYKFVMNDAEYLEVYKARTWADYFHVTNLQRHGANINRSNCLILNDGNFHQELLYPDEPVRHKVLDCIGDLSLLFGTYIKGSVVAFNAGHKLHHKLMDRLIHDFPVGRRHA